MCATPRFVLTTDQDWAPEWALAELLEWSVDHQLPLHVFRTGPSQVLDEAVASNLTTQGWHPNLAAGSSHGSSLEEIVEWFSATFPRSRSVRGHGFQESSAAWAAFSEVGIRFDSQFPSAFSAHLVPTVHFTGIIRLPVFLEDDLWLLAHPGVHEVTPLGHRLFSPGLKIFNLHAAHLALNTPSTSAYETARAEFYSASSSPALRHQGVGIRNLFDDIVSKITASGGAFESFDALCDEAAEHAINER